MVEALTSCRALIDAAKRGELDDAAIAQAEGRVSSDEVQALLTDVPEAIAESLQGLERVTAIVRSMSEFAHPGGADRSAVDLNALIEATVTLSRSEWRHVADLETRLSAELPPVVCNRDEIGQTVLNILVNAAHAIAEGPGADGQARGKITVTTVPLGDWVEIQITDDGPGIPEALREKVMRPFVRLEPDRSRHTGGVGLGLAIVHRIMQAHRGRLIIDRSPLGGALMATEWPAPERADA